RVSRQPLDEGIGEDLGGAVQIRAAGLVVEEGDRHGRKRDGARREEDGGDGRGGQERRGGEDEGPAGPASTPAGRRGARRRGVGGRRDRRRLDLRRELPPAGGTGAWQRVHGA